MMLISFMTVDAKTLKVELKEIKSIKKSSKIGYENDYLFVAKVENLSEILSNGKEKALLPKNSFVEILADKNVCYDEVKMALLSSSSMELKITNLKKLFFKNTPKKSEYNGFLKVGLHKTASKQYAGCVLTKKQP